MYIDERQATLLRHLIEEYVDTVAPVGSKLLAEKYDLAVSPATVRNDMALLEEEGYVRQPHISAGRVPTEKAYRFWIERHGAQQPTSKEAALYRRARESGSGAQTIKELAKVLSDEADTAVVVALGPEDFYYTGLSALFGQPEFADQVSTVSLARVMDHMDWMAVLLVQMVDTPTTLLGRDNPFDRSCGFVGAPYVYQSRKGCIGVLGPLRMHYPKNMGRIKCVTDLLAA